MTYDPFDAAMNADQAFTRWFGQIFADVWACALVKGEGKVPYDKDAHGDKRPATAIDLELVPVDDKFTMTLKRNHVHFDDGWKYVVLPSLKAAGIDLRNLDRTWVALELDETGETYTNNEGRTVKKTAFKFIETYPDRAACLAAYREYQNDDDAPATEPEAKDNGKEKETARAFLKPLWMQSGGDRAKFADLLSSTAMVSDFFSIDSPEVQEVMSQ
jgi:hypothetical protein